MPKEPRQYLLPSSDPQASDSVMVQRFSCLHRKPYLDPPDNEHWYLYDLSTMDEKSSIESIQWHIERYRWSNCYLIDLEDVIRNYKGPMIRVTLNGRQK